MNQFHGYFPFSEIKILIFMENIKKKIVKLIYLISRDFGAGLFLNFTIPLILTLR